MVEALELETMRQGTLHEAEKLTDDVCLLLSRGVSKELVQEDRRQSATSFRKAAFESHYLLESSVSGNFTGRVRSI